MMNKLIRRFNSENKDLLIELTRYFSEDEYYYNYVNECNGRYFACARLDKEQFNVIKNNFNLKHGVNRNDYIVIS